MKKRISNRFGTGGCYVCRSCDRKTRDTGRGDNENCGLCVECYEMAGVENQIADHGSTPELQQELECWRKEVIAKGGSLS